MKKPKVEPLARLEVRITPELMRDTEAAARISPYLTVSNYVRAVLAKENKRYLKEPHD